MMAWAIDCGQVYQANHIALQPSTEERAFARYGARALYGDAFVALEGRERAKRINEESEPGGLP